MKRQDLQFGPWTTSLHHSSRLELSAFWRRRLERLGSLAGKRPRLSWPSALALCLLAGVLFSVPRLQLDSAARAEEQPARSVGADAKPQVADQPRPAAGEEPFTATFSNGVKVQLIGLSENPSQGKPWWGPDGTRLEEAPYARVPAITDASEGQIARELCWRWINLPDDPDVETNWMTEPHYSGAGGGKVFDANGKEIEGIAGEAVSFAETRDTCMLRFSVSVRATPWETVFTNEDGNPSAMSRTVDGAPHGAIFSEPRADKGGTSITVSHQIPGKAVRLMAVGKDGLVDRATSTGGGALGFSQHTYHFAGLSPDKIQTYKLQSQKREFETIEFRNVSLHPEKQTKVEIVRLAPDEEKSGAADESTPATPSAGKPSPAEKGDSVAAADAAQERYRKLLELQETLTKEYGYRLESGQPLKRLPPPYSKAREEYWALNTSPALYRASDAERPADDEPPEPGFMLLQWTGNELQRNSFHFREPTLRQVLDTVFDLKLQDLAGDLGLLTTEVPGDWVTNWDSRKDHLTNPEEIAVLEGILRDELKLPVRLTLRDVERPVYVAKGSYKFTAVAGPDGKVQQVSGRVAEKADGTFQIPLRRSNISASVGSYQELMHTIGEVILKPIVDEVTTRPKKESFFMTFHGDIPLDYLAPFDDAQVNDLLESIAKQTGLTFSKETRPVKTLVIERDAAR